MKLNPVDYRQKDILERNCNELIGICKGIIADGKVCQSEAEFLLNWLNENYHAAEVYPGRVIANRLARMFEDNAIDSYEREELLFLLQELTGMTAGSTITNQSPSFGFNKPLPSMSFNEVCFCLTGTFEFGTRESVIKILKHFNAIIKDTVPKKQMSYLVVGSMVSEAWKFSTHGRKLETALNLREQGYPIYIVPEEHMWSELESLGLIVR